VVVVHHRTKPSGFREIFELGGGIGWFFGQKILNDPFKILSRVNPIEFTSLNDAEQNGCRLSPPLRVCAVPSFSPDDMAAEQPLLRVDIDRHIGIG
jgi:hypothetical protein